MPERKALGRGLDALISRPSETRGASPVGAFVPVQAIRPGQQQPRRRFDEEQIEELAQSIGEKGVLQPLVVRRTGESYEIIIGERRWRAARRAGLKDVPVVIREAAGDEALELALVENLQREDLGPIEVAEALRSLVERTGLGQEAVAQRIGKDRSTVANYLRLLSLPLDIQKDIAEGVIDMGHARAMLALPGEAARRAMRDRIVEEGLSVREVEGRIREKVGPAKGKAASQAPARVYAYLEDDLKRYLQTKVRIRGSGGKGTIEINYYSEQDLDRVTGKILGDE